MLLGKLKSVLVGSGTPQANQDTAVAKVIRAVGGGIASVSGCEERLGEALRHAEDYYTNVVSGIPGPIPVSGERLGEVPVLGALFPSAAELSAALAKSIDVKETVAKLGASRPPSASFHALLGMRRRTGQADSAGGNAAAERDGAFADHTVRSLGADAEDTREQIREAAMQRLLKRFTLRGERLNKMRKMLRTEWHADLRLDHDPSRQARADSGAHLSHSEFVYADRELTPERTLESLIEWLWVPEIHLRLIGSANPLEAPPPGNGSAVSADHLPLLVSEDRRRWFVCLVQFSAADVISAAKQSSHAHRYILI